MRILILGLVMLTFIALFSSVAYAINPPIPPPGTAITLGTLETWLDAIANFILVAGGILIVIFIIWSGILYMSAGDDQTKVKKAKEMFKGTLIGALIILGINLILSTILAIITGSFFG